MSNKIAPPLKGVSSGIHRSRQKVSPRKYFFLHFRPLKVDSRTVKLTLSWGLGGMAAFLILTQFATGLLLKFVFDPTPSRAYQSVQDLVQSVPFGALTRNIHYWGANLLVIISFAHLMRVFCTGAWQKPRQFNWIIGGGLFISILAANFTGYLLPWDQLSYWAVTVASSMLEYIPLGGEAALVWIRGGRAVGGDTLQLFYALHTAFMPLAVLFLMSFHFWKVRRAGGLITPKERGDRVDIVPNLLVRELSLASILFAVLLLVSIFFDAPLGDAANPGLSPNPTRAPWYFAGFQELLMHVPPVAAVFVIPLGAIICFCILPYLPVYLCGQGRWLGSYLCRSGALLSTISALSFSLLWVVLGAKEDSGAMLKWLAILPLFLLFGGGGWLVRKVIKKSGYWGELVAVMAFFAVMTMGITLTLIGTFLRGKGMQLVGFCQG